MQPLDTKEIFNSQSETVDIYLLWWLLISKCTKNVCQKIEVSLSLSLSFAVPLMK